MPAGPRRVGRYVLEDVLGSGGMGAVYRALDPLLNRHVALKLLLPNPSHDEATRAEWSARMLREARAASAFAHPNVVAVYDVGIDEGAPFIAMELVSGRTLRSCIGDNDISIAQRIQWLIDIARALAEAHRVGIVHRDVKPDNILVTGHGVVKILDFGIARSVAIEGPSSARQLGTLTAEGTVLGTPRYMAPEQIRSEVIDGRTDQFAWGVVAFELLTGRSLWAPETEPLRVIASILTSEPPPPRTVAPAISEAVSEVVERALAKRAVDRFDDMDAVADALEDAGGAHATRPRTLRAHTSARRANSRGRGRSLRIVAVVAILALLIGVGGGLLTFARRPGRPPAVLEGVKGGLVGPFAVLPFENVTALPEDSWLRLGLAEALQTKLSSVRGFSLVAQTEGAPPVDAAAAQRLGARWIIVGSFQKVGDRIRVAARAETLTDPPVVLASTEQRGTLSDVFELQDAVAMAFAQKLDKDARTTPVTASPSRGTRSVAALEAIATGRSLLGAGQTVEAMRAFDRALRADPAYRDARVSLNRLRAESHHFLVKPDGTVVETISETLRGDPTTPWQLTTDSGTLSRAWDLDGTPLDIQRVSASGNQATFRVTVAPRENGEPRGIVYELESSSKDRSAQGLSVLFHSVAKNSSGEDTFIVQLPEGARAVAVVPTPVESHEHEGGTSIVIREARTAFAPYAWSVVHASDPATVKRFRDSRPAERAAWIVLADAKMSGHGWALDLARASDVADLCGLARGGALDRAKDVLARMREAHDDYGTFFLERAEFCVGSAEHDDRGVSAALEAAIAAPERPIQLIPEAYSDAIDWCLERKRVDDMARLVRLERRRAPWWHDGLFHQRLDPGDEERALRSIVLREPGNVAAVYDLALVQYDAKKYEQAEQSLRGVDEFLGGVYVADLRARLAVARGQPADAANELRKVVTYYPMTWAWVAHAVMFASAGRADEAFAFIVQQAPKTDYQLPLFWALRYVVGLLPHPSNYADRIVDIVSRAKEVTYGEPYRAERMIELMEAASLSLDPEGPVLMHRLCERLQSVVRQSPPEACGTACLGRIGSRLCRVRGLSANERAWAQEVCGVRCE